MNTFRVTLDQAGMRIDKFLQEALADYSRTDIQKLMAAGQVLVNGAVAPKNLKTEDEMEVQVLSLPVKVDSTLKAEKVEFEIVYEDEDIIVINKPRNLVVHPGNGAPQPTLAAGLLHHYNQLSGVNGPMRPGIVHRLDKDTPGLMVAARTDAAHLSLAQQLEARTMERQYLALVWGHPRDQEGVVDQPMERDPKNRTRMGVFADGKRAVTHYKILETFRFTTLLSLKLETGRTHQIRVHMRHSGTPVVGDPLYDGGDCALHRIGPMDRGAAVRLLKLCPAQLLQAVKLSFTHPRTGKPMQFEIPLENAFQSALDLVRNETALYGLEPA